MNILTTFLLLFNAVLPIRTGTSAKCPVAITISNIRSTDGCIRMGIYVDEKSYEDNNPIQKIPVGKNGIKNGTVQSTIYLEPGTYGVALIDDENSNGELDYGFVMPKEGFGFSNYYHTGLKKPSLEKFKFTISAGQPNSIAVKLRYL